MNVNSGYIGWCAETERAESTPVILMRKDMAKKWTAELVDATENIVKVRIKVNDDGEPYFLEGSVYVPLRQSNANADIGVLESESNTIMGGGIKCIHQQYMRIEGAATAGGGGDQGELHPQHDLQDLRGALER